MRKLQICLSVLISFGLFQGWVVAENCPTETAWVPATITGTLEYHPGVYGWYGVRPDKPICGQNVIQLGFDDGADFRAAHRFTGCKVTATGDLFVPATGYWSTSLGITGVHVQQDRQCKQGQPLPDYSTIPIPSTLDRYEVAAKYDPRSLTFSAQVRDASSGKLLSPWQRYVTDGGNGARDLQRLYCADGFLASDPKDPSAPPDFPAGIDPDFPQAIAVTIPNDSLVRVSFVCSRSRAKEKP